MSPVAALSPGIKALTEFIKAAQCDIGLHENGPWMIPECVPRVTGEETGEAIVVDVGGSTLRVSRVRLPDVAVETLLNRQISERAKVDIFGWLSDILRPLCLEEVAVGWSFPLLNGCIQPMGKGFRDKYVGRDLLGVFRSVGVNAVSVTHDGTAALLAEHYTNAKCNISLTLGTGVNISVFKSSECIVNTEISMLGREDLCATLKLPFDSRFDLDPGFQPLEAMIGGPQLGKLVSKLCMMPITTDELWGLPKSDPKFDATHYVLDRAAFLVAGSLHAVAGKFGYAGICEIAYTGGVIAQERFRELLDPYLSLGSRVTGIQFRLKPQSKGSEIGAAVARLAVLHLKDRTH